MVVNIEAYSLVKTPQMYLDIGHDGLLFFFGVVQERYLHQIFRYKRDESSNSTNDSPQLLNALSS